MAGEPNTPNTGLIVPNTGDLVGTWGSNALNPDFVALDGLLGGTQTISLTSGGSLTLSTPAGVTIVPSAGPTQSQNSCIILTGTLTNNTVIILTIPGRYVFHNKCLPWNWYVQIQSLGAGSAVGLAPGKKTTVYHDGTNVDFVDQPDTGTAYDLHGVTTFPAWMTACTTLPYLVKDGTVYEISAYPYLGGLLGSTFGGDGINTFAVPDEMARARIAFDTKGTNRLTTAGNGTINGTTMASAGGNQLMQQHNHGITDPGHLHLGEGNDSIVIFVGSGGPFGLFSSGNGDIGLGSTASSPTGITVNNNGSGNSQNVQPSIISFLPLIKT